MPEKPGAGSDPDRRQFERVPARIELRFSHPSDAARALRAYSLNFSVGGLCIKTQRKYEIGELLRLELKMHGRDFRVTGVVAWTRKGAIGVRFKDLTDDDRDRLSELMATFKR